MESCDVLESGLGQEWGGIEGKARLKSHSLKLSGMDADSSRLFSR